MDRKTGVRAGAPRSGTRNGRTAPAALLGAAALCFVAALGIAPARAADIRVAAKTDGPTTIVLEGPITKADLPGMERAVEEARRKASARGIVLSLNSPGGAHFEALRIGLLLRREGIGTILPPGAVCASACSSIFFGGFSAATGKPNRVAYETARLGVHRMVRSEGRRAVTPEETKRVEHAAQKYFDEAGVPARIQAKVFETPPNELYVLTRADMIESGIAVLPVPPGSKVASFASSAPPSPDPVRATATAMVDRCRVLQRWRADGMKGPASHDATACFAWLTRITDRDCPADPKPPIASVLQAFLDLAAKDPANAGTSDVVRAALATAGCKGMPQRS